MSWQARVRAFAVVTTLALPALAEPTKRECIDTNAKAQVELNAGHLRAAKRSLQSCAIRACPGTVRKDCAERLEVLLPRIPSLVLEAKDAAGNDLAAVSVQMDGEVLTSRLDGTAIELDPGEHRFTFETADAAPVERTIVIREGEIARREKVVLGNPVAAPVASEPERSPVRSPERGHAQRVAGVVVAGVGVAGLAAGVVMGIRASSKQSEYEAVGCVDMSCTGDARKKALPLHESASSRATASTVGFVAGGILAAGGVVLYLTAPHARAKVGLVPAPNGALLVGSF